MIKNNGTQCRIEMGTGDVRMTPGVCNGQAALALNTQSGHEVGERVSHGPLTAQEFMSGEVFITASDQKSVLVLIESLMTSYIMAEYGTYPGEGSIPYDKKLNLLHDFIYQLYGLSDEPYKGGDSDEN